MASGVNFFTGLSNLYSSIRGTNGKPDGLLAGLVAGTDQSAQFGAPKLSPHQWIPDSELGKTIVWDFRTYPHGPASSSGTTDGLINSDWFTTLTNSGTNTQLGTAAGYEGKTLSTTGATSGNQNAYINTMGFKSVTNRVAVMYGEFFMPDPNVNAYDFYFGFGNKQADPAGTQFTDGAWIQGVTAAGAIIFGGKTRTASGTASSITLGSAAAATIASGVPRTIQMAVVLRGQAGADFWVRDPSISTNAWSVTTSALTPPAATVVLRPHMVDYTRTANVNAINIGQCYCSYLRNPVF